MNKKDLVAIVSEAAGVSKKDTEAVVKATFEALKALRTAEEVAKTRGISVDQVNG